MPPLLTGTHLREAFATASAHLDTVAADLDVINVYPVPDGDTGSNMAGTVREAVSELETLPGDASAGQMLAALAQATLYSARGNSGVILSQAFRGLATRLSGVNSIDGHGLAEGLNSAADAAYHAVAEPKEGTMLTVLRAAAVAASDGATDDATATFRIALVAAEDAAAKTMYQMDILQEAGVTDAGGEGVCALFRGLLAALEGKPPLAAALGSVSLSFRADHRLDEYGYCTEFVLESSGRPIEEPAVLRLLDEAEWDLHRYRWRRERAPGARPRRGSPELA